MGKPDISNLAVCIEDVRLAAVHGDPGPSDPSDFSSMRGRLESTARQNASALS